MLPPLAVRRSSAMKAGTSIVQPLAVATAQHSVTTPMARPAPFISFMMSLDLRRSMAHRGLKVQLVMIFCQKCGATSSQNLQGQPPAVKRRSSSAPAASVSAPRSSAPKFICRPSAEGEEMHLPGPSSSVPSTPLP